MPLIELELDKDIPHAERSTSRVGEIGESLAARHLRRSGYRLAAANFRAPIGRNRNGATVTGEIDIVALDGETLCFVEVKTRSERGLAGPLAAVDPRKQRQIIRTAKVYRRVFGLEEMRYRFDAVGIILNGDQPAEIELSKGHFRENASPPFKP